MASAATSAGEATILIIFEPGTDPNVAVLNVQNRIHTVKTGSRPWWSGRGSSSADHDEHADVCEHLQHGPSADQNFLYNYAYVNILPEIKRVRGIGSATILGSRAYRDAGLAESRPHAGLQRVRRRRHEGSGGTEHDRFARTTRPGDGQDVANGRVRPDLGGALQQAGAV